MSEVEAQASLYERIGGADAVDLLVERFYGRMDELADAKALRAMHAADLTRTKATLKSYLSEWLGGPKLYTPEKGHPRMRQRHMGLKIGDAERDAWMMCMRGALAEAIIDGDARQDVEGAMSKLADWMRNQG